MGPFALSRKASVRRKCSEMWTLPQNKWTGETGPFAPIRLASLGRRDRQYRGGDAAAVAGEHRLAQARQERAIALLIRHGGGEQRLFRRHHQQHLLAGRSDGGELRLTIVAVAELDLGVARLGLQV